MSYGAWIQLKVLSSFVLSTLAEGFPFILREGSVGGAGERAAEGWDLETLMVDTNWDKIHSITVKTSSPHMPAAPLPHYFIAWLFQSGM